MNSNDTSKKIDFIEILFFLLLGMPMLKITSIITIAVIIGIPIVLKMIISKKFKFDYYLFFTTIFFISGELLAIVNCPDITRSIRFSIQKLIVLLVLYPICKKIVTEKKVDDAFDYFSIGCSVSAIFVFASSVLGIKIPWLGYGYKTLRLIFSDFGPNVVGRMFCIGSLYTFYRIQKRKGKQYINIISFALMSFAVITTVSFSSIILLILGIILIFLFENKDIKKYGIFKIALFFITFLVTVLLIYKNVSFVNNGINKLLTRVEITSQEDISNGRLAGLNNLSNNIKKFSIIGVGYGCSYYVTGLTIHFPIIASIIETGILGFISCIIMYFYILISGIKKCKLSKKIDGLFIISALILLGDMIQPNANYLFTWFAIYLGSICIGDKNEKNV